MGWLELFVWSGLIKTTTGAELKLKSNSNRERWLDREDYLRIPRGQLMAIGTRLSSCKTIIINNLDLDLTMQLHRSRLLTSPRRAGNHLPRGGRGDGEADVNNTTQARRAMMPSLNWRDMPSLVGGICRHHQRSVFCFRLSLWRIARVTASEVSDEVMMMR